jgi:signal transduction histidine kinase
VGRDAIKSPAEVRPIAASPIRQSARHSWPSQSDAPTRYELRWQRELASEICTLRLFVRCARDDDHRILCGDESGRIGCLKLDGASAWSEPDGASAWSDTTAQFRGPVNGVAVLHPPHGADASIDPRLEPCLVAAGAGSGELLFFDYLDGKRVDAVCDGGEPAALVLPEAIHTLLYLDHLPEPELWAAVADGSIHRFTVDLAESPPRLRALPSLPLGEMVAALSFVAEPANASAGWVCAATTIGNVYRIDPGAPHSPSRPWYHAPGPILSCVPLSPAASREGCVDVAITVGDSIRHLSQPRGEPVAERPRAELIADRYCADRVFCLAEAHFDGGVWLLAGASDRRLLGYGVGTDSRFFLRFPARVLQIAVREDERGVRAFVALDDHRLQALQITPRHVYAWHVEESFRSDLTLRALLDQLRGAPDDASLRRQAVVLLFRTGWLSKYIAARWEPGDEHDLELILYSLLTGGSSTSCREMLEGLVRIADERALPAFRRLAAEMIQHIDRYCIDGRSFSDKPRHLDRLAHLNEVAGGRHLYDAALYYAFLAERRYTVKHVFELSSPLSGLSALDAPAFGARPVLLTSYLEGRAWILGVRDVPEIELHVPRAGAEGPSLRQLQHVFAWGPAGARRLIFFYRDDGWTSIALDDLTARMLALGPPEHRHFRTARAAREPERLPEPRGVQGGGSPFYIYSSAILSGSLVAVGGRSSDVRLLRIGSPSSGQTAPELEAVGEVWHGEARERDAHGEAREYYAPVWTLAFRATEDGGGEVFAGCENGACYRLAFTGASLGAPQPVWRSLSAVRVVVTLGADRIVLGDASGFLVILQRATDGGFSPVWMLKLEGAVTGVVSTELGVSAGASGDGGVRAPRPVLLVSDSLGVMHLIRPDVLEHDYAFPLRDGERASIERLAVLPRQRKDREGTLRVAVACFNKSTRILSLPYRRESARHLYEVVARLIIALSQGAIGAMEAALAAGLGDGTRSLPQIVCGVVDAADLTGEIVSIGDVRAAIEYVALKSMSTQVGSEAPGLLALRLRYDQASELPKLLDALDALAFRTADGARPHQRLKYCLHFAFKSIAELLGDGTAVSEELHQTLARFVHLCHSLCHNWGPDLSEDNVRAQLNVARHLFRSATPATLEWLLGDRLKETLEAKGTRPLSDLVGGRFLHNPRLSVTHRTLQYVRHMIARDADERLMLAPVKARLVPLLVRRMRSCLATPYDWVGMELYLCFQTLEADYGYSQWRFVLALLEEGCSLPVLGFLADRQRILPPRDPSCQALVAALARRALLSGRDEATTNARVAVFEILCAPIHIEADADPTQAEPVIDFVRYVLAIGVAFDSSGDSATREIARRLIRDGPPRVVGMRSIDPREVALLGQCAACLIKLSSLSATDPIERARPLYRDLREHFRELPLLTDAARPDALRELLAGARECVHRQMEIELDFVAPITFLRTRSITSDPIADHEGLGRELSGYAAFHHDLSMSERHLLITKDPGGKGVVIKDSDEERPSLLTTRAQIDEYVHAAIKRDGVADHLVETASQLLWQEPFMDDRPSVLRAERTSASEIIPLIDGSKLYGVLYFAYGQGAMPDPSKRALSRMIPQVLLSEFLRAQQTRRLLALMFHHISAPISAMRVMLVELEAGRVPSDSQARYFSMLTRLVSDCRLMIQNHQNYMRIARGISLPLAVTAFDVVEEVEFRRRMINYKYKSSRQTLSLKAPPSLEVKLDRMMVGDIVQNLLDNACKYSPAQTEVQITIERSKSVLRNKGKVFITVTDQGPGVPPELEASLYREGVRGAEASMSAREGLGLGLFMVSEYTRWLDGVMWYERVGGESTKFTIQLPIEVKQP